MQIDTLFNLAIVQKWAGKAQVLSRWNALENRVCIKHHHGFQGSSSCQWELAMRTAKNVPGASVARFFPGKIDFDS
jgi:hypothetical protein